MKAEIQRRAGKTQAVIDLFQCRPGVWIDAETLAKVGGFCAWRTRVSDARKALDGSLEWNGDVRESMYRFVPQPPKVTSKAEQLSMFEGAA